MVVVYDVVIDEEIKETIKPVNQRMCEMYWSVVDRVEELKCRYGDNVKLKKRMLEL